MDGFTGSQKRETVLLRSQTTGTFGSRLTYTVGVAYMSFGLLGFVVGLAQTKRPNFTFPNSRVRFLYYMNSAVQNCFRYAHNASVASLMYTCTGFLITRAFDEELSGLSNTARNTMIGAITGGLYKSTRGMPAAFIGAAVGASIILSMNLITDELRERDLTSFEMKFEA